MRSIVEIISWVSEPPVGRNLAVPITSAVGFYSCSYYRTGRDWAVSLSSCRYGAIADCQHRIVAIESQRLIAVFINLPAVRCAGKCQLWRMGWRNASPKYITWATYVDKPRNIWLFFLDIGMTVLGFTKSFEWRAPRTLWQCLQGCYWRGDATGCRSRFAGDSRENLVGVRDLYDGFYRLVTSTDVNTTPSAEEYWWSADLGLKTS